MPKSKRDKKISLTKTKKKDLHFKQQLMNEVRRCVDTYSNIFVFSLKNQRNAGLKELRSEWRDSRFFFGKNKVMALGLGLTAETEVEENLHLLARQLKGQCGLLFTNRERDEVLEWFESYCTDNYAKTGFIATKTIMLPAGSLDQFPCEMEPLLRQLGLKTTLKRGVVTLLEDTYVCQTGNPLKPEQARLLKLLGHPLASFQIIMKCVWSRGGTFKKISRTSREKSQTMEVEDAGRENEVEEIELDNGNDLEESEVSIPETNQ